MDSKIKNIYDKCKKSFLEEHPKNHVKELYDLFIKELHQYNINLQTGKFGANMEVHLINDGPNTFILES